MSTDSVAPSKINIGRVIGGTFQVVGRNLVTFTILGLVLSGIPTVLLLLLQAPILREQMADLTAGTPSVGTASFAALLMRMLVDLISSALLQGALIYATVQHMNGQRASVGAALATGLHAFAPLLGVAILFCVPLAIGALGAGALLATVVGAGASGAGILSVLSGAFGGAMIVAGAMLAVAWCVAAPALVADRTTVRGAFQRATQLTQGNRWSIFALIVLLGIGTLIVAMILASVLGVPAGPESAAASQARMLEAVLSPTGLAVTVVQRTLTAIIGAAGVSVLYIELRKAREGSGARWLAEIFH